TTLPVQSLQTSTAVLDTSRSSATLNTSKQSLVQMLIYAFIDGLILNVIPCVLPVITLKILGFVKQTNQSAGKIKTLGLLYTAGVLISFLVLAMSVIAAKATGNRAD